MRTGIRPQNRATIVAAQRNALRSLGGRRNRPQVMHRQSRRRVLLAVAVTAVLGATACDRQVAPRAQQAADLTVAIRAMPGVASAGMDFTDNVPQGQVHVWLTVEVAPDASSDQVGAITDRYLQELRTVDYSGYRTELDIRQGDNRFAVDSGEHPVINDRQIVEQSRNWVWLRDAFPGATLDARATIARAPEVQERGDAGHPFAATLSLPESATYTAVSAAAVTLTRKFPQLGSGVWVLHAGASHPADITTFRRFPNANELAVWNELNADQDIPHVNALTINAPATPPVWISEQTTVPDVAVAVELATRHLPRVATLAPPVLYTSGPQLQAARNSLGRSEGPVAVTIGGCTPRGYRPEPAELALIDRYENCGR
jgi:hypothetical protein